MDFILLRDVKNVVKGDDNFAVRFCELLFETFGAVKLKNFFRNLRKHNFAVRFSTSRWCSREIFCGEMENGSEYNQNQVIPFS